MRTNVSVQEVPSTMRGQWLSLTDISSLLKHMDTKGGKWRGWGVWAGDGGMNWEIGIDIYTLIYIKWITNKNLLY